jgi:glutamyl-tRNA synthetase
MYEVFMTQIDARRVEQEEKPATGNVRLRFAPSPTGFQHIGGYRTALYSWLYARHCGGQFILRIEDTDVARTVEGAVDHLLEGFKWLGMDIDEGPIVGGPVGPYYQTERKALYQFYANQLIASGHAYKCYCTPERLATMRKTQEAQKLPPRYDRHCRYLSVEERAAIEAEGKSWTVRFAMPSEGETVVRDELHGNIVFQNANLDDAIILKSDGLPTYHLALVDDHLMGITHILRGEEWISSAPLHVQIYEALGWQIPHLYHMPNILGKDKRKLSKRRNAPSWDDYKREGYLPEAVLNFMALLGWSYDEKTEIFTKEELIHAFTLDRVGVASGIYDPDKLLWMNGLYIRKLTLEELTERTLPYMERPEAEGGLPDSISRPLDRAYTLRVLRLEQERMKTLGEAAHMVSFFYTEDFDYDPATLIQKGMDRDRTRDALLRSRDLLNGLVVWEHSAIEAPLRELIAETGMKAGQLLGTIRTAVSGRAATPPLFDMMEVLGRDRSLSRIERAIEKLG